MKSILVVDDEKMMRQVIENALSDNYVITCTDNGVEAQAQLADNDYDLVITDLVMPEMNGIDLLNSLKQARPDQKIIAISGGGGINGRFDYLPVAKLLGACTVLRKPFQIAELRDAVEKILA